MADLDNVNANRPSWQNLKHDILAQIYIECMPSTALVEQRPPTLRDSPLNFTAVCAHWRDVALRLPSIWTIIEIDGNFGSILSWDIDKRFARYVRLFARNSQKDALHIRINRPDREPVPELTNTILRLKARWKTLRMVAYTDVIQPLLSAIGEDDGVPMLEALEVDLQGRPDSRRPPVLELNRAPKLRWLAIINGDISIRTPISSLNSLTSLRLKHLMAPEDYLSWLELCPNLEEFYLLIKDAVPEQYLQFDNNGNTDRPEFPNLKVLCLQGATAETPQLFEMLLDRLLTPNLRSLSLTFPDGVDELHGRLFALQLHDFLQQEGLELLSLDIRNSCLPPDQMKVILGDLTHVRELTLSGETSISDELIDALTFKQAAPLSHAQDDDGYSFEGDVSFESEMPRLPPLKTPSTTALHVCPDLQQLILMPRDVKQSGDISLSPKLLCGLLASRCGPKTIPFRKRVRPHPDDEDKQMSVVSLEIFCVNLKPDDATEMLKHPGVVESIAQGLKMIANGKLYWREYSLRRPTINE